MPRHSKSPEATDAPSIKDRLAGALGKLVGRAQSWMSVDRARKGLNSGGEVVAYQARELGPGPAADAAALITEMTAARQARGRTQGVEFPQVGILSHANPGKGAVVEAQAIADIKINRYAGIGVEQEPGVEYINNRYIEGPFMPDTEVTGVSVRRFTDKDLQTGTLSDRMSVTLTTRASDDVHPDGSVVRIGSRTRYDHVFTMTADASGAFGAPEHTVLVQRRDDMHAQEMPAAYQERFLHDRDPAADLTQVIGIARSAMHTPAGV
jgi:hypothetical protein